MTEPDSEDEDETREVGPWDLFLSLPRPVVCLREGRRVTLSPPSSSSSNRADIFIIMLF